MAQERTLVGAETYIVGDYHFTKGNALPVKDEHIEYIDSLKDANDEPLFSADAPKAEKKTVTISKGKKPEPKSPEGDDTGDKILTV